MYNNRSNYNSNRRQSARYNTPGKFVPAAQEEQQEQQQVQQTPPLPSLASMAPAASRQFTPAAPPQLPPLMAEQVESSNGSDWDNPSLDTSMEQGASDQIMSETGDGEGKDKKFWMRVMKGGVKKVSNKERRRRQNETLRRLLTPKNALMVLNEMIPVEQGHPIQYQVEATPPEAGFFPNVKGAPNFCAELSLEGQQYRGYGENKSVARTNAAEQAFRDLVIKKMTATLNSMEFEGSEVGTESSATEEPPLPMMQLASFALHKLFSEWQAEGYKVPLLRTNASAQPGAALDDSETASVVSQKPKKVKEPRQLPPTAADMHPCMLLGYMRTGLTYHEVAMDGDKPQNITFTVGVEVDGQTFLGKANSKKEARKIAARAACQSMFNVVFNEEPSSTPAPPSQPAPPNAQWEQPAVV